ncbi:MAG: hypothetical protein M1338_01760 [Patescibacteria group bacterium]|nr:hypothetical protein [Patescibacteria group bacterium]
MDILNVADEKLIKQIMEAYAPELMIAYQIITREDGGFKKNSTVLSVDLKSNALYVKRESKSFEEWYLMICPLKSGNLESGVPFYYQLSDNINNEFEVTEDNLTESLILFDRLHELLVSWSRAKKQKNKKEISDSIESAKFNLGKLGPKHKIS